MYWSYLSNVQYLPQKQKQYNTIQYLRNVSDISLEYDGIFDEPYTTTIGEI